MNWVYIIIPSVISVGVMGVCLWFGCSGDVVITEQLFDLENQEVINRVYNEIAESLID
jgi:hypothetical protein